MVTEMVFLYDTVLKRKALACVGFAELRLSGEIWQTGSQRISLPDGWSDVVKPRRKSAKEREREREISNYAA